MVNGATALMAGLNFVVVVYRPWEMIFSRGKNNIFIFWVLVFWKRAEKDPVSRKRGLSLGCIPCNLNMDHLMGNRTS